MVSIPARLLAETVPVRRHTADPYGGSWATVAEPKARVSHTRRLVRDDNGDQVVSSATVYFAADVDVRLGDRLEVDGADRTVLQVARRRNPRGRVALVEARVQ